MKGLLIKDLMTQRKQMIMAAVGNVFVAGFMILVILSIYYGNIRSSLVSMSFFEKTSLRRIIWFLSFVLATAGGYTATLVTAAFVDDDKAGFEKVSGAIPVGARERVQARYLFYGLYLLLLLLVNLVTQPLLYWVAKMDMGVEAGLVILAGFSCCTLMVLIDMPLIYRFGTHVSTVVNMVFTIGICFLIFVGLNYCADSDISTSQLMQYFVVGRNILAFLFLVLLIVGIPLSGACSLYIQKGGKKQLW